MEPMKSDTFRTIANRLTMFRPQLDLAKYIKYGPQPNLKLQAEKAPIREQMKKYGVAAANTTLDGVTFVPNDWEDLIITLRKMGPWTAAGLCRGKAPGKTAALGARRVHGLDDRQGLSRDLAPAAVPVRSA